MSNLSLSRKKENIFPTAVTVDGEQFQINADFRNILKILRLVEDDKVNSTYKLSVICKWFYSDSFPRNALIEIVKFITLTEKSNSGRVAAATSQGFFRQYDFEFDADEIYAPFLKEYHVDLFEVPFLHYRKFVVMLENLSPESPFKQKIALRFKDLSGLKGKAFINAQEAKEAVQLPVKLTAKELAE